MKKVVLLLSFFLFNACTYNIVQQQNGSRARNRQAVSISGGQCNTGVGVAQGEEGQAVIIGGGTSNDPPPSTYPDYNGYPGSGWRYDGGPIAPAYDPRAWGVPNCEVWRYRVYLIKKRCQ